ncbi:cytochrome P450 [Suillus discolor]|uniref:Cytochrome P450 n=1 Tax=Suillus discolor TaxID=1912936 RepID=A0A9P7JSC9_9AGAM|nr:cytochrome P450 [Suillus discolor]KAG2104726.1 cytochrome P450 [Suillus discolor]
MDIWLASKDHLLHTAPASLNNMHLSPYTGDTSIFGEVQVWSFGLAKTVVDSNITNELIRTLGSRSTDQCTRSRHALGKYRLMLWDPKANLSLLCQDTSLYHHTPFNKIILPIAIGRGVMGADGESHRRINPTFNAAAVRSLTSIFQDVAHKDESHLTRHAGIGILSHDFGALDGNGSDVEHVLNAFSASVDPSNSLFILGQTFPSIMSYRGLAQMKAEESGETVGLTQQEVLDEVYKSSSSSERYGTNHHLRQARILLLGAFETTAVSLTWAFIELGRNPDIQTKFRDECLGFGSTPSYDDLTNKLPYLNAVVNEVLRLHSPVVEVPRAVTEDDVIPLGEPLLTADGKLTDHICIAKGTEVVIPLAALNRSVSMWGPDAKVFKPSRWLKEDEGTHGAGDVPHGYRHLMTFGNGSRMCPGRLFALTQFKTVLFILVRHFVFEMADGADVQIVKSLGLLPRPSVVGSTEVGCSVPLRVRRYEPMANAMPEGIQFVYGWLRCTAIYQTPAMTEALLLRWE